MGRGNSWDRDGWIKQAKPTGMKGMKGSLGWMLIGTLSLSQGGAAAAPPQSPLGVRRPVMGASGVGCQVHLHCTGDHSPPKLPGLSCVWVQVSSRGPGRGLGFHSQQGWRTPSTGRTWATRAAPASISLPLSL